MAESSAGGGLSLSGGGSGALSPSPELLAKGKAKERELIKGLRDFFEQKGAQWKEMRRWTGHRDRAPLPLHPWLLLLVPRRSRRRHVGICVGSS